MIRRAGSRPLSRFSDAPACDLRWRRSLRSQYGRAMWDVLKWQDGTLSVAWWAVIVLVFLVLVAGGSHAARR